MPYNSPGTSGPAHLRPSPAAARPRRRVALVAATALLAGGLTACTPGTRQPTRAPRTAGARSSTSAGHPATSAAATLHGTVLSRAIPGRTSHFEARPARIYVPAAVQQRRSVDVPVVELLRGTPGSPVNWITDGGLAAALDALAARHGGVAPIVVMPDINGSADGDTECVHAARGDVEQYLVRDVPDYITAHFPVAADRRRWAIGGVSEGGTCALVLALRHPDDFASFVDLSGLRRPTVGDTDDEPGTVARLFGGSQRSYDQHDPAVLMTTRRYPGLAGWLACGDGEPVVRRDQDDMARLARRADVAVHDDVATGIHSWRLWSAMVPAVLCWLWSRLTS